MDPGWITARSGGRRAWSCKPARSRATGARSCASRASRARRSPLTAARPLSALARAASACWTRAASAAVALTTFERPSPTVVQRGFRGTAMEVLYNPRKLAEDAYRRQVPEAPEPADEGGIVDLDLLLADHEREDPGARILDEGDEDRVVEGLEGLLARPG